MYRPRVENPPGADRLAVVEPSFRLKTTCDHAPVRFGKAVLIQWRRHTNLTANSIDCRAQSVLLISRQFRGRITGPRVCHDFRLRTRGQLEVRTRYGSLLYLGRPGHLGLAGSAECCPSDGSSW